MGLNYKTMEKQLQEALHERNVLQARLEKLESNQPIVIPQPPPPPVVPVLVVRTEQSPQELVAVMMKTFGQSVRYKPSMPDTPEERLLRATLVLEEAIEFVEALGFEIFTFEKPNEDNEVSVNTWSLRPVALPDMIEAADAIADILVVTYGGANALGINADKALKEVHKSNMTKVRADGTVERRPGDGKVVKPSTYEPPNMHKVLVEQGWDPNEVPSVIK